MAEEVELKRRNSSGDLVNWNVNDDGSSPVADSDARTKLQSIIDALGEVGATPTANTLLDRLKDIHEAVDGLEVSVDTLNISNSALDVNTDEVETKLEDIKTKLDSAITQLTTLISDVAKETTLATVAKETTLAGVAKETTLTGVAKETTLQDVAKETTLAGVAKDTTLQGVAKETTLQGVATQETLLTIAKDDTVAGLSSRFQRLLKFEPSVGEELRAEENTTDRYHGAAPDDSDTNAGVWDVVRFYKDANDDIIRVRFKSGIIWDDKENITW